MVETDNWHAIVYDTRPSDNKRL